MGLLEYQKEVREDSLRRKYQRETAPWDADLAQTPPLPKDWERWYRKVGIPENYIFYQYSRKGAKTGYCTYCEREVPIRNPKHNKQGVCPGAGVPSPSKRKARQGPCARRMPISIYSSGAQMGLCSGVPGNRVYSLTDHRKETASFRELRRVIYDRIPSRAACTAGRTIRIGGPAGSPRKGTQFQPLQELLAGQLGGPSLRKDRPVPGPTGTDAYRPA